MWTSEICDLVLTKIKYGFSESIKNKYPQLKFTTEVSNDVETRFPTVSIKELPGSEQALTLDGTGVSAVLASFQIDVIDDKSVTNTTEIMDEVLRLAKQMRFELVSTPVKINTESPYRIVMRMRRMIGEGDIL